MGSTWGKNVSLQALEHQGINININKNPNESQLSLIIHSFTYRRLDSSLLTLVRLCCRNNSAVSLNSRSANQHPTFVTADCSSSSSCQSSRVPLTFCHERPVHRCLVAYLHRCRLRAFFTSSVGCSCIN